MALRGNFHPFDLTKLRSLLGSGDEAALTVLISKVREGWKQAPDTIDARLRRAIFEGSPLSGVEVEDEWWAVVAHALAEHGQELDPLDFDWHASSFGAALESLDLDGGAREALEWLAGGRPLFGDRIESSWTYYAYLTKPDVELLRVAMDAVLERGAPRDVPEAWVRDLRDVCVAAQKASAELWMLGN